MMIKRQANIEQLIHELDIPNLEADNVEYWEQIHQLSIQRVVNNNGILPVNPPFEKHPYLVPLDNDIAATGVMIGTFPPLTYLCSQFNLDNLRYNNQSFTAPIFDYFHGNYTSLWKYTPIDFDFIIEAPRAEQPMLTKDSLTAAGIVYSDIIKYTQRTLNTNGKYDAGDNNLSSIIPNEQLIQFLLNSESVNRLYFTNSSFFHTNNPFFNGDGQIRLNENDAFGLFIKTALDMNVQVEYSLWNNDNWVELNELPKPLNVRQLINGELKTKVLLELRLIFEGMQKVYKICSAVSPAAVNRGRVRQNPCVQLYRNNTNCLISEAPARLLSETLSCFFNNNLNELAQFNVN